MAKAPKKGKAWGFHRRWPYLAIRVGPPQPSLVVSPETGNLAVGNQLIGGLNIRNGKPFYPHIREPIAGGMVLSGYAPSLPSGTATFVGNFDSGTLGAFPNGSDGFLGSNSNNSPNPAEYDNTRSVSGSQSAKINVTGGSVWFGITGMPIPGGNLSEGDEIWLQIKQWIPTGFDFTVTQGGSNSVKWFNFAPSIGTSRVYWNFGEEFGDVIRMDSEAQDPGHTDITYTIPRDQWVTFEIYMLVTETSFGATPTMRIWADHVFIGESFEQTLGGGSGSVIDEFRVGDYWNDNPTGAPQTQSFWLDDLIIYNGAAGDVPTNTDAGGRTFIGNVG